jgi:hypothetical protein
MPGFHFPSGFAFEAVALAGDIRGLSTAGVFFSFSILLV